MEGRGRGCLRADVGPAIAGATGRLTDARSPASPRIVIRRPRTRRSFHASAVGSAAGVQAMGVRPWSPEDHSLPWRSPNRVHSEGLPRSIRIAPAPLNSDRLPSMRRRQGDYLMGFEVWDFLPAETFAGFEMLRDCLATSGFSPWGILGFVSTPPRASRPSLHDGFDGRPRCGLLTMRANNGRHRPPLSGREDGAIHLPCAAREQERRC